MELTLLGKKLGEYSGWDQIDTLVFSFTDVTFSDEAKKMFKSSKDANDEASLLSVNFNTGEIQLYNYNEAEEEYYKTYKIADLTFITDDVEHLTENPNENEDDEENNDAQTEEQSDNGDMYFDPSD